MNTVMITYDEWIKLYPDVLREPYKKCTWCNGEGKIKCDECNGSGDFTCDECGHEEPGGCEECSGTGFDECTECNGTGDFNDTEAIYRRQKALDAKRCKSGNAFIVLGHGETKVKPTQGGTNG
jgi:hypothetical protein